jgi:hypothetical protein
MTVPRREQRKTHLDASVVPVERALLARADKLENEALSAAGTSAVLGERAAAGASATAARVAAEFRVLAEELHWWA